jgi:two-component system, LytTR family, sensor histidine kinase AlgZ
VHPLLRDGKLGLYFLAWLPIAYILSWQAAVQAHLSWPAAITIAVPLCLAYAFICPSAWYACRSLPLARETLQRVLLTHLVSAAVAAGIWTAAAAGLFAMLPFTGSIRPVLPAVFAMGLVLYLLGVAIFYVVLAVEVAQEAQAREAEARLLAGKAELRALKAQVNPHFLFNSLHSISALTSIDAGQAREMCVLLGGFLRSTLGLGEKTAITLAEEIALVRSYLAIEQIRFGSRLEVREEMESDCEAYLVPPLLLQPLVENAVVHGIARLIEPGLIRIAAQRNPGGGVSLVVENSFDADDAGAAPSRRAGGFGLVSVRKRLEAHYNGSATLRAAAGEGRYRVEIQLPEESNL